MIQSGIYSSVNGQITTACHLCFTSHLTLTGASLLLLSNILVSRTASEAATLVLVLVQILIKPQVAENKSQPIYLLVCICTSF